MFSTDYDFDEAPTGNDLLAEIGLDSGAIQDVIDDDLAMRCPDRDTVLPPRRIADFTSETPLERAIHDAFGGDPLTVTAALAVGME